MIVAARRFGRLRQRDRRRVMVLLVFLAASGLVQGGAAGISLPAALLIGVVIRCWKGAPVASGWILIGPADPTTLLWLDHSRVVLGNPWRVIYRDELSGRDYCWLRRRCLGLPE